MLRPSGQQPQLLVPDIDGLTIALIFPPSSIGSLRLSRAQRRWLNLFYQRSITSGQRAMDVERSTFWLVFRSLPTKSTRIFSYAASLNLNTANITRLFQTRYSLQTILLNPATITWFYTSSQLSASKSQNLHKYTKPKEMSAHERTWVNSRRFNPWHMIVNTKSRGLAACGATDSIWFTPCFYSTRLSTSR